MVSIVPLATRERKAAFLLCLATVEHEHDVAKHLALLEEAGLVEATGETRRRSYRITPGPFSDAMEWMVDVGATWDARLGRLKRLIDRR